MKTTTATAATSACCLLLVTGLTAAHVLMVHNWTIMEPSVCMVSISDKIDASFDVEIVNYVSVGNHVQVVEIKLCIIIEFHLRVFCPMQIEVSCNGLVVYSVEDMTN